jgi:hypothetical protein
MAEISDVVVATESMLIEAARTGDLESLTIWATQGLRVTTGRPLCVVAEEGYLEGVRCLVQQMGANVSQTYDGDTSLITAALNGFSDLVRLLVTDLGADINQGDSCGATPLYVAALKGQVAVVRCLFELGARIVTADDDGRTAVHIAASRGHSAVMRCLIELGADVGAMDSYGDTALLFSARSSHYATMQYLLEHADANMDDVNNNGETVWGLRIERLEDDDMRYEVEADTLALPGLLRFLVLRGAPPPALLALLSPEPARVVQEGARLRAQLPAYLAYRCAYLNLRCPRICLLPDVLRALIYSFEGLATTEELWAMGLGQAP